MNENPYYSGDNEAPVQKEQKSGLSITAFVLSVISILSSLFLFNIPLAIISIILAVVALVKKYGKKGLAAASVIISSLSLAVSALIIIMIMPVLSVLPELVNDFTTLYSDKNYKEIIEEYDNTGKLPEYFDKYSEGEIGEFFDKYYGGFENLFESINEFF